MRSLPLNPRIQIDSSPSVPGEDAWLLGVGDSVRKEVVTCKASVLFFPLRMNPPPNHVMYPALPLSPFHPLFRSFIPRAGKNGTAATNNTFFFRITARESFTRHEEGYKFPMCY